MNEKYPYKIVYTIFFKDGTQESGEELFESVSSKADSILLDEILPHLNKIEQLYQEKAGYAGMKSEIVPAQSEDD